MSAQSNEHVVENDQGDELPAPPGSHSTTTFVLKRVEASGDTVVCENSHDLEISSVLNPSVADDFDSFKRSLKFERRPWIVHDQLQSDGHSDSKPFNMCLSPDVCLPKGVVRGCSSCADCQQVTARWTPEAACFYELEEAPVFHPSYEEFKDTFKYIESIRQQVEPYGFCRIVPPPSWKPPCFLEEDDIWQSFTFHPDIQRVNELQNQFLLRKAPADNDNDIRDRKRRKLGYECGDGCAANFSSTDCHGTESLLHESCPQFNLIGFKRYADYFKQRYFTKKSEASNEDNPNIQVEQQEPSEQSVEGEYWRIVEKPTEEIEVLCGTRNLSCESTISLNTLQKSDFLESSDSVWDLNSISCLPGSLLSFEKPNLADILVPQLHIGMCFSSVPWTLEEHNLYRLEYLHLGSPRIWYGISKCDTLEFEDLTEKHFPDIPEVKKSSKISGNQPSLGTLKSEGVPVYRSIQRPGDFVLFLPGVYYSGFDCGFNCSASAAFAPLYWLPDGLTSTELYRERKRKTSISYDKLLLNAADEVVKARWGNLVRGEKSPIIMMWKEASGVITKALRARIQSEARSRQYLSPASRSKKMDKSFGGQKRECCICFYDLYLSAVTCPCNPNKYSCLAHAKHLCSCAWTGKVLLFRYQISELNVLAEAVEAKITSMRDWVREDLGKALQCDEPEQGEYGFLNPYSFTEASDGKSPSPEKLQASGSRTPSKEKDLGLEELFTDDFKKKALEFILNGSPDDASSSSSSDWDIDAAIEFFQSEKAKSSPSASNQK